MNIESRTDSAKGFRTHLIRGEISLPEIKTFLRTLYLSREYNPNLHALWDATDAVFPEVGPADVRDLAYFARVNWAEKHRRKTAIVVSGDFHFGLSRMLEQFIGPLAHGRIKTFRDLPAAVDWLVPEPVGTPQSTNG